MDEKRLPIAHDVSPHSAHDDESRPADDRASNCRSAQAPVRVCDKQSERDTK